MQPQKVHRLLPSPPVATYTFDQEVASSSLPQRTSHPEPSWNAWARPSRTSWAPRIAVSRALEFLEHRDICKRSFRRRGYMRVFINPCSPCLSRGGFVLLSCFSTYVKMLKKSGCQCSDRVAHAVSSVNASTGRARRRINRHVNLKPFLP